MSKPIPSRPPLPRGPFPALIPVGRHAGRPAISLRRTITLIGSRENAHVRLAGQSVDPAHALLIVSNGQLFIRDLASQTGILVNDEPAIESELLADDQLQIGSFRFRLSVPPAPEAPHENAGPPATLTFKGHPYSITGHVFLFGRREGSDLLLSDPKSSRTHAAIVLANGSYTLRDLGSRAGTLVNGAKVHEQPLEAGDLIELASHEITFDLETAAASPASSSFADLVSLNDDSFAVGLPAENQAAASPAAAESEEEDLSALDRTPSDSSALPLDAPLTPDLAESPAPAPAPETESEDAPIPLDLDPPTVEPEPEPVAAELPVDIAEPSPAVEATEELDDLPLAIASDDEIEPQEDLAPAPPVATEEPAEPAAEREEPAPLAAAAPAPEEPAPVPFFGFGTDQDFHAAGSPLDWNTPALLGSPLVTPLIEVSLSGVHGPVDAVEPETTELEPEDAPMAVLTPDDLERSEEMQLEDLGPPPAEEPQLLGVIRFSPPPDLDPAQIEPVASIVEPDLDPDEPVELPLDTDTPGQQPVAQPETSPDSLHAVKPPPAAYGVTRGLSSLTSGGRAVDVFSQMPVPHDDPVLGKVAAPAAAIPSVTDPSLPPDAPLTPVPTHDELTDALKPHAEFDSPADAVPPPGGTRPLFVRKFKRFLRGRGRTLSIAAAMTAAGVGTYGLTPATSVARAEVTFHNFDHLSPIARQTLSLRQRELLTDPAVLATAGDSVVNLGLGFLADPVALSKILDGPGSNLWPADRVGTLIITLHTSDPDGDAARLRALTRALADAPANRDLAAKATQAAAKLADARRELAGLTQNITTLEQRLNAQARLASAAASAEDISAAVPELSAKEKAWHDASLAALRAQAEVNDLSDKNVAVADPRMKAAQATFAAARVHEEEARSQFLATQDSSPAGGEQPKVDPERAAAETAASLRSLQARHATVESKVNDLQGEVDAGTYPEIPKTGGVWVNPVPDHRNLYALAAAAVVGLSMSAYLNARRG